MAFSFSCPKMRFSKEAERSSDLLAKITSRGATIQDRNKAFSALSRIGYYRLTGYMLPFQTRVPPNPHSFITGTTFESVLDLYHFDCKLRSLLMTAFEPIEVAFRSSICNKMAISYGPHWHTDASLFDEYSWNSLEKRIADALEFDLITNARKSVRAGGHLFLDHYYGTYHFPAMPPCWMLMEVASFGLVAKIFEGLVNSTDRRNIASEFTFPDNRPIDETILNSWIHGISVLRNRCAHHSRLVFRSHPFTPRATSNRSVGHLLLAGNTGLREFLVTTAILNRAANPKSSWLRQLYFFLDSTSGVNIERAIGFPRPWATDPLWQMAW